VPWIVVCYLCALVVTHLDGVCCWLRCGMWFVLFVFILWCGFDFFFLWCGGLRVTGGWCFVARGGLVCCLVFWFSWLF